MLPPSVEPNDNSPRSPNNNSNLSLMARSRGSLCVPHTPIGVVLAVDTKRRSWCGFTSPSQGNPATRRYGEVGQINKQR